MIEASIKCPHCLKPVRNQDGRTGVCVRCGTNFNILYRRPQNAPSFSSILVARKGKNVGGEAICANHQNSKAEQSCERCGDFICNLCATPSGNQIYCPKCFEINISQGKTIGKQIQFKDPKTSFTFGLIGLLSIFIFFFYVIGLVAGPIAVIFGVRGLRKIEKQDGLTGKGKCYAGIVMGILAFILNIGMYVGIFYAIQDTRDRSRQYHESFETYDESYDAFDDEIQLEENPDE